MDIFKNYNNYKKHENAYIQWKNQKDIEYAKKMAYLKANPISEDEKKEAEQRGKVLINAIDIMDEYSQVKAQDIEIVTDQIVGQIMGIAVTAGMFGGMALIALLKKKNPIKNDIAKDLDKQSMGMPNLNLDSVLPYVTGILASVAASIPLMSWAAQAQIGASRRGRFEAMKNDLDNPNKFAILDKSQEEQAKSIAKDIPVDAEMKKHLKNRDMNLNPFGFITTIKELFAKNKEYETEKAAFEAQLKNDKKKLNAPLSPKDTLAAKKDQQLLSFLVQKIDIASQDYSENVELATNSLTAFSMIGGGLTGWISNKIIKNIPMKNPAIQKMLPWGIGLLTTIGVSAYATTLQKQASRIGRYKAKKELQENVNNFVYVDEEKLKSQPETPLEKAKKPGYFKFLGQVIKENKEYKKYLKTEVIEDKKYQKALEKIQLDDEQVEKAKVLQKNTFKTFNKVDENSQKYSESVEAVGQIIQSPVASVGTLVGMGLGGLVAMKRINKIKLKNISAQEKMMQTTIPVIIGAMAGTLPAIGLDIYITKEQKKASRVADMMAIQELTDYREFA